MSFAPYPDYHGEILKKRFHSENASNVCRPHYPGEISPVFLDLICVWGKPTHGNHVIIVTSSFSKSSVFKMFSVHTKTKNKRFQIPAVRKAFPKSPDFRDGLVWKAGITVEINLRFIFCVGSWNRVSKITNLAGVFTPTTLTKSVPNDCSLF